MSKNVLNIGAGLLPIVPEDINADVVYNYDPLDSAKEKIDSKWFGVFAGLIHDPHSGIIYKTKETDIRATVPDNSIDLLIGVSPYGFSLVTGWVDQKLKVGAQVLVAGNSSNKWVTNNANLFSGVAGTYTAIEVLGDQWSQGVKDKIAVAYLSQTSALEKDTALNTFRYFVKAAAG